jgi:hypothetical protein
MVGEPLRVEPLRTADERAAGVRVAAGRRRVFAHVRVSSALDDLALDVIESESILPRSHVS